MAAAAPEPVVFALNPASAITGVIDMKGKVGGKVYEEAVTSLFGKGDTKYGCEPENMLVFLKKLKDRCHKQGWSNPNYGILHIPREVVPGPVVPVTDSLLTQYGTISMARIRAFEDSYIRDEVRAAQDTSMLYECLMASLSLTGVRKIMMFSKEYMIGDKQSGNLLLKVILRESHLDSNATTSVVRLKLSSLDNYMPKINSDISQFNAYVQILVASLQSRGESSNDLLVNLFKGYEAASDKDFRTYVSNVQDDYDDGRLELTPDSLMVQMDTKFKALQVKGKWQANKEDEEKLIALESTVTDLRASVAGLEQELESSQPATQKDAIQGQDNKRTREGDPDWLSNNTKPNPVNKVMTHKGKPWHFCCEATGGKCGGKWRRHKPKDCKGFSKGAKSNTTTPNTENGPSKKKLRLAKALMAIDSAGDGYDTE